MYRGVPTPVSTLYPRRNMVPNNVYVNDPNFILPPRLISQEAGQPTASAPNPEDDETSPAGNAAVSSPSSQLRNDNPTRRSITGVRPLLAPVWLVLP